jgi:hypothetical protein
MRIGLVNNRGQAAAELAILGVLILMSFSFVMNFGQSLGRAQQNKMVSFRKALKTAYDQNGTAIYTFRKSYNSASADSGFFQGKESTAESSYNVTWSKGVAGPHGTSDEGMYAYWQINNAPAIELPTVDQYHYSPTGQESDNKIATPTSVYKVDDNRVGVYNYNLSKQESNQDIDYNKNASVVDTSFGFLHTRINTNIDENPGDDNTPTPRYSVQEPRLFGDVQVYNYSESWDVPHD